MIPRDLSDTAHTLCVWTWRAAFLAGVLVIWGYGWAVWAVVQGFLNAMGGR